MTLYCACPVKVFVADYEGRWISRVRGMFEGASPWDVLRKGNGEVSQECSAVNPLTEACFVHVS